MRWRGILPRLWTRSASVCDGCSSVAIGMERPIDIERIHITFETPYHAGARNELGPPRQPQPPVVSRFVVFRSAKERPFAERKATLRQTETSSNLPLLF